VPNIPFSESRTEEQWCGDLIMSYPEYALPTYNGNFKDFARQLLFVEPFAERQIPRPEQFHSWEAWVMMLRLVMEA